MFSLFWFVLYLMDRLIHVKNDVQLSTPRGFYTTFRNLSDNSFLFSTPSTSTASSVSSSHFRSTQPTLTITLAEGNVLDAFRLMNFHRSKMNEYLCDDFITAAKITPVIDRFLDSDTEKRNIAKKLIHDVGSNSYKTWLMRTINKNENKSERRNSSRRQDEQRFEYAKGHYKKPFYKIRGGGSNNLAYSNNHDNVVEDEDIYFGMSLPAHHANRYKESSYPIYQSTRNQTSVIPITLSMHQKRTHPTQLIPNENIIGINLHGRYVNLTESYRKNFQSNVTPRDTFQRSDASSNKETVAIYVTENNPPSMGQEIIEGNPAFWTSESNVEFSNYNGWPVQGDNGDGMQRNPQIPAPDTSGSGDSFGGYSYTTMAAPPMDNNAGPYTRYYPSITESPREYTYPPYYPPSEVANGNNGPYGYPGNNIDAPSSTMAPTPPGQFPGYQAPVTSTLYGYQPPITSWPYGWVPTTTTTQKPMVIGWMPMTTPVPSTINMPMPPSSSMMPPMMAMIPMVPTPPPATAIPTMPPMMNVVPMMPVYGFPPSMPTPARPRPPEMSWVPSTSTPLPYGIEYTFNPPNNQNPNSAMLAQFTDDLSDDMPPMADDFNAAQLSNDFSNNAAILDQFDYDSMQDSQDLQDSRDNAVTNILGPDAYELILTVIAFMAFGTYFMNTMLQLMQGNSPPTMMVIGNGGNTGVPADSNFDVNRKFSNNEYLGLLDEILISIDEFHDWLYSNETK